MRKHVRTILRVFLGCIGLAWLMVPVGTWKGFLIFASVTMLIAAIAILYGLVEDEEKKKAATE
jgi:hypothetical protein